MAPLSSLLRNKHVQILIAVAIGVYSLFVGLPLFVLHARPIGLYPALEFSPEAWRKARLSKDELSLQRLSQALIKKHVLNGLTHSQVIARLGMPDASDLGASSADLQISPPAGGSSNQDQPIEIYGQFEYFLVGDNLIMRVKFVSGRVDSVDEARKFM